MKKIDVKITVTASGIMEANQMRDALQNVVNEMADNKDFLLELADKKKAAEYGAMIKRLTQNSMVKRIASFI